MQQTAREATRGCVRVLYSGLGSLVIVFKH